MFRLISLLAAAIVCAVASPAWSHARMTGSEPAAEAMLHTVPQTVLLHFNEPVSPLALRWFGPDGKGREVAAEGAGTTLTVTVPEDTVDGTQILSWRVVSADGHPIAGSLVFSIGHGTAAPALPDPVAGAGATAAAGRYLLTLALAFGVGGAVFASCIDRAGRAPAWSRHLAFALCAALPVLALLAAGLIGRDLAGVPGLLDPGAWSAGLRGPFAPTAALTAAAGLSGAFSLRSPGRIPALLALALGAASFAASGHAARAHPVWLMTPAMVLHGAGLIFWLGALPGLAGAAAGDRHGLAPLLQQFSRVAVPLVALLLLSGICLAAVQLGQPAALFDTAYGRLLCVKLLLVAGMLVLAAVNRLAVTPRIAAGGKPAALLRTSLAEILLGLAVLGLASGFRLTPPPRTLVAEAPAGQQVHLHGAGVMAIVALHPGRAGPNQLEIDLTGPTGAPLGPREVTVALSLPDAGLEPITLTATGIDGLWHAGPVHLPVAGGWTMEVGVLIDDFTKAILSETVEIAP